MRREPQKPISAEITRFQESVGELWDGEMLIGHLAVRVEIYWTTVGHLWWRREIDPEPWFEYVIAYSESDRWEEGVVVAADMTDELRDWDDGRFELRGRTMSLRWLS